MRHHVLFGLVVLFVSCQSYDFVFQPDTDRQGNHLRFVVEQPSKADILFVIDNSISMTEEQVALSDSIGVLLAALAPQDTRYRIGITSTDAIGFETNCSGEEETYIRQGFRGAKGDCSRTADIDPLDYVALRRPHDGALGRLVAAYDSVLFDTTNTANPVLYHADGSLRTDDGLTEALLPVLAQVLPTGLTTHPPEFDAFTGFTGDPGARWVIDRETVRMEACQACSCTQGDGVELTCDEEAACIDDCVEVIAPKMVEAYFRANVAALGVGGQGWEEGLEAASLAAGIDPEDPNDETALNPTNNLLRVPGGINTFTALGDGGLGEESSWLRAEALLAVMLVSDEEDCSMPPEIWDSRCYFEEGCPDGSGGTILRPGFDPQPGGSLCYQESVQSSMLSTSRMAQLLTRRKGGSASRVAVGFIGGVAQVDSDRVGSPVDCAVDPSTSAPTTQCSCLDSPWNLADAAQLTACGLWCQYTRDTNGVCMDPPPTDPPYCDALAGSRYVDFANAFRRRTFESVCRAEAGMGFGDAMAKFAQIATLACFELEGVAPAGDPPDDALISVMRAARADAEQGLPPTELARTDPDAATEGWYYDTDDDVPRICLTGLDRLIGDVYDIFVLTKDRIDFTH
jgi:hypothetical protein